MPNKSRCKTCFWFDSLVNAEREEGFCMYDSPVITEHSFDAKRQVNCGEWPLVSDSDRCRHHSDYGPDVPAIQIEKHRMEMKHGQ